MSNLIFSGLADGAFLPHGYCFLWQPELLIADVTADAVIAVSYLSIPAGLFVFARKRTDLEYKPLFLLFAAFIVACGFTHMFDIITLWDPVYKTQAVVKLVTAAVSAFTAMSIWPILPKALALPSPSQLRDANDSLRRANDEFVRVNAELEEMRDDLERRVAQRTAELSEANAQLAAREAYYRTLYQVTPVMMQTLDRSGRIHEVNNFWTNQMGYARKEVIGRRVQDLAVARTAGDQAEQTRADFWATGSCDRRRLTLRRKDGATIETEISGVTHPDANEDRAYFVVVDVTERETAERQLRRQTIELKRVNEGLAQFAYVASHDLQEPLRKIAAFSDVLSRALKADDPKDIEYAYSVMRDSALRARQLVGDLLAYSRYTNAESSIVSVDVGEVARAALLDLSEAIGQTRAKLYLAANDVRVDADRSLLQQVLQNLIANAIKYHKPDTCPRVRVSAAAEPDGTVRIEVADDGIGFDAQHATVVFEPFKRLHTRTEYPGSGIGLAICKSICDRHGWSIDCESRSGVGSTFRVRIPLSAPENPRIESADARRQATA
jgi:PAS domain S-box-containing protein